MQIDLAALPDDPIMLLQMLREVLPELQAENEKLWQLIQRLPWLRESVEKDVAAAVW